MFQVIVMEPVVMTMSVDHGQVQADSCHHHDYENIRPIVIASAKFGLRSLDTQGSAIIAETQSLFETISIPGSVTKLVYSSPRSRGYLSTIQLQLTPESIPAALSKIYLRITIEGELFEKIFEADPNLKYTYSWKGVNVYRQRVYGSTTALVKVGYEYESCAHIIWNVQSTRISGQDLSVSNIGGWDLDIHHRYNFQEGIMYKGDGTNIYLKETPALIHTLLGDGTRRTVDCGAQCEGPADQQTLLSPFAIVSTPDGSLYLGDFNLIRKINSEGQVRTILKLNATSVAHRYYLAVNPQTGSLYVSDPEAHRILEIVDTVSPGNIEQNYRVVVGSGLRCLPGDEDRCGDGGPALHARLIYPKGLSVTSDGNIYFADGTTIRMVDSKSGHLVTLIKPHLQNNHWKPLPCEGTLSLEEAKLRWPTELAVNPLDNSVHFIDDNIVMKVTRNGHLKVVAGRPLHCSRPRSSYFTNFASYTTLASPQALAFSPTGELNIAESDARRINRISVVGTDGRISVFAGKDSKCNCQESSCDCFNANNNLAVHSLFKFISGLAVTPDGSLHICDQTNYRIRTIKNRIPHINPDQQYEVHSPETGETYVFNRFGLHMATRSIATKENIFQFSYSVSTSTGSLVSVTDSSGTGKISIIRNYAGQVESIENAQRQKFIVKVDTRKHMLKSFMYTANNTVDIDYYRSSELLRSRRDGDGKIFMYDYDQNGRVERAITPTGGIIQLKSDISIYGAMVNISTNNKEELSLLIQKSFVHKSIGHEVEIVQIESDRSFIIESKWGHKFVTKTAPYILLHGENPGLAESYPVPSIERTEIGKDIVNTIEWDYYANSPLTSPLISKVGKKLKVNGESVMSVELDRSSGSQVISMESHRSAVTVNRTKYSSQISSLPTGIFPTITEQYNPIGLPTSWSMGSLLETYSYDRQNRLTEVKQGDNPGGLQYLYDDIYASVPTKVIIPSGGTFSLQHDNVGSLRSIITPRGHVHTFMQQLGLGSYSVKYQPPWSQHPFIQQYDQSGALLSKQYPGNSGKLIFVYDHASHLRAIIGGSSTIHYHYVAGTALVNSIDVIDDGFHMKTHKRHHRGSVREIQHEFLNNVGLNNYTIRYQCDATGRLSAASLGIIGLSEQTTLVKYDSKIGKLKGLSDLRISYNLFKSVVMEDLTKNFVREKKYDDYGRFQSLNLIIKGQPLFRVNIEYNSNSQISLKSVFLLHKTTNEEVAYNANNQVNIVKSEDSHWVYAHDVNGNIVSVTEQGKKYTHGYDSGDRVVEFGPVEFVTYDDRGFVIRRGEQRYTYNALGQMISALEQNKFAVRFYYDDQRRLIGVSDHRGNTIQYMYSNPGQPRQVTHVHDPKLASIQHLLYDEEDLLVAIEPNGDRFYVATDDAASPIAVFDTKGKILKQIKRTPFGRTMHDSNPGLVVPIDFHGGILDYHTRLVHYGDRVYDPVLGQWMTPDWETLSTNMDSPFKLFTYRFLNNNPINRNQELIQFKGMPKNTCLKIVSKLKVIFIGNHSCIKVQIFS